MSQNAVSAKSAKIKKLVTLAMLTAVTYVVMLLCKSIPDVAGFLQLEVKDTVICIGGFIFFRRRCPETKGKTLEDLEKELTQQK